MCCWKTVYKDDKSFLYANITGNEQSKYQLIGKGKQITSFKNVNSVTIRYDGNRKACMTSEIFCE